MVDVFEEVEDELRTERYQQLARRLMPWVIAGALIGILVVGGVYGYRKYQDGVSAKAAEAYAEGLKTLGTGDTEAAFKAFGQVGNSGAGYRSLALSQQAAIRLGANKTKEAVALLDQAADAAPKGKLGQLLADAARLKSAFALMDQAPYAEIEGRLKPLTEENRPYRAEAREALAMAKLNAGKIKEARQDFVVLSLMTEAPESLRGRARTVTSMIDAGLLDNLPAVVKAAAALPPGSALPPGLVLPNGQALPPEVAAQAAAAAAAAQGGAAK